MHSDPIADLLTRVRNAQSARKKSVSMPSSKTKVAISRVLESEGYIGGYRVLTDKGGHSQTLEIELKYGQGGEPAIRELIRISKPGCRRYFGKTEIPKVRYGLGTMILSTPRGVIADRDARELGVGGEAICSAW